MGWKPWRALRERPSVEFALVDLPEGLNALLAEQGGDQVILINRNLSPVERLAALAHELVHLERGGSGHQVGLPPQLRVLVAREEHRVDRIAALRLVPLVELEPFIQRRAEVEPITAALVAEEFGVSESVAALSLDALRVRGAA